MSRSNKSINISYIKLHHYRTTKGLFRSFKMGYKVENHWQECIITLDDKNIYFITTFPYIWES